MKAYQDIFQNTKTALIPFFVLGDPTPEISIQLIKSAIDAGADILELGIPFSDPIADGPTIQKADIRALNQNVTCKQALDMIRQIKDYADIPVGLLMYYNLITNYGPEKFYQQAASAGVNSILIADLNIDDADEVTTFSRQNGIDTVFIVSSLTGEQRKKKIVELCSGFVYTIGVLGVTGARAELSEAIGPLVKSLKAITDVPVCVGFGVSKPEHARTLAKLGVSGVIVGSAVVRLIEENLDNPEQAVSEITTFVKEMKAAVSKT